MKFSKEEIQNSMLLYAVTDRMWLKDGEGLTDVCRKVLENGSTAGAGRKGQAAASGGRSAP